MKIAILLATITFTLVSSSIYAEKVIERASWKCPECGCGENSSCGCNPEDGCDCVGADSKGGCHCEAHQETEIKYYPYSQKQN